MKAINRAIEKINAVRLVACLAFDSFGLIGNHSKLSFFNERDRPNDSSARGRAAPEI
jgi:hypothetical protein